MTNFIHQIRRVLKPIFILLPIVMVSCNESNGKNPYLSYPKLEIELPSKNKINVYVAVDAKRQKLGLSHVQPDEFNNNDTMLFTGEHYQVRQFWMPETHFNLDIIFLSPSLEVLDIHRNVSHYKGKVTRENKDDVPLSKKAYCQHVLEIKTSSPLASEFTIGLKLKATSKMSLLQSLEKIISSTHP
jgi:uncharacterized membrane protein (UPF0127 family)